MQTDELSGSSAVCVEFHLTLYCSVPTRCSLKGVPLAYDNIRIVGQHGHIHDDSGYIHMDIEANFIVFQPMKGQKLLVRFPVPALS